MRALGRKSPPHALAWRAHAATLALMALALPLALGRSHPHGLFDARFFALALGGFFVVHASLSTFALRPGGRALADGAAAG